MDDRELDLDALERIASAAAVRAEPATAEYSMMRRAQELLAAHITASTVLKLIALARPKAGGVEAQGDDKKFGDGTPDGFFITFADGSTSFEFTEEDRDEALADALPGAKWDAVYKRAAAPEPLRVAGEVKEMSDWLDMQIARLTRGGRDPSDQNLANKYTRLRALIEVSAGGGDRLVPVRVNDEWPFPMPVPPPVQDLRYGMYLNLRDMVRAAYRRRHLDPRLGHFIETNYADYLATFDEIDLALSPTPDQPKQEVKDV